MKYEELVNNPENELKLMAKFLSIPYSDAMANYHAGKTRDTPGRSAKSAWLPPVKNLRSWRKDMSVEDIGVFEGIAGNLLRENGYTCLGDTAGKNVTARVERCLSWWSSEGKGK